MNQYTCPYCGKPFTSRVIAGMHYADCPERPQQARLSQEQFAALLENARQKDARRAQAANR